MGCLLSDDHEHKISRTQELLWRIIAVIIVAGGMIAICWDANK